MAFTFLKFCPKIKSSGRRSFFRASPKNFRKPKLLSPPHGCCVGSQSNRGCRVIQTSVARRPRYESLRIASLSCSLPGLQFTQRLKFGLRQVEILSSKMTCNKLLAILVVGCVLVTVCNAQPLVDEGK